MVVFGLLEETLHAKSRTRHRSQMDVRMGFDLSSFVSPLRAFCLLAVVPFCAAPVAILHGYGFLRCLWTMKLPYTKHVELYDEEETVFIVHKRKYDLQRRKIVEKGNFTDTSTIDKALSICGKRRDEFVDDPQEKGTSYLVIERPTISREYMYRGRKWTYGFLADVVRHIVPMFIAFAFFPAMKYLSQDLVLWRRGQLPMTMIRHPISNFFLTVQDYNKARARMVSRVPTNARPWNYKL